jgi:hypothetical protein
MATRIARGVGIGDGNQPEAARPMAVAPGEQHPLGVR